jgi:hypothetical protein
MRNRCNEQSHCNAVMNLRVLCRLNRGAFRKDCKKKWSGLITVVGKGSNEAGPVRYRSLEGLRKEMGQSNNRSWEGVKRSERSERSATPLKAAKPRRRGHHKS